MQLAGYLNQMITQVNKLRFILYSIVFVLPFCIFYLKVTSLFQLPILKLTQRGGGNPIHRHQRQFAEDGRLRVNSQSNNNKLKLTNPTLRIKTHFNFAMGSTID